MESQQIKTRTITNHISRLETSDGNVEQARRVKAGMGVEYVICWDAHWSCYRVVKGWDHRVGYELKKVE